MNETITCGACGGSGLIVKGIYCQTCKGRGVVSVKVGEPAVCRGSLALKTACGKCSRCTAEIVRMNQSGMYSAEEMRDLLASTEPKCSVCGQGAWACNEGGCHYLESGNGAPVERKS